MQCAKIIVTCSILRCRPRLCAARLLSSWRRICSCMFHICCSFWSFIVCRVLTRTVSREWLVVNNWAWHQMYDNLCIHSRVVSMAASSVPRKHVRCLDQCVLWNEGQGLGRRIYQIWNLANLRKPIVLRSTARHEGHMLQWASITVPRNGEYSTGAVNEISRIFHTIFGERFKNFPWRYQLNSFLNTYQ